MKKMFLAAFAAIALVSCGKEELPTIGPDGNADNGSPKSVQMRVFTGLHCINYIGTCFPDVVVNGNDKKVIDDVFDVIGKGNQSDIKTAFVSNRTVLEKYVDKQTVADVIAGSLDVTSTDGDSGGTLHYMVFKASGKLKGVYPFQD